MANILVVDDEIDICNLVCKELEAEGYTVFQAFDGQKALEIVAQQRLHLAILDWMLPGIDGLTVCRRIRQQYLFPVIMLTARTEEVDRILGLEVGADDYVSKPFSVRELTARVRAMLRRVDLDSHGQDKQGEQLAAQEKEQTTQSPIQRQTTGKHAQVIQETAPPSIILGDLCINIAEHTVLLNQRELDLTPREYQLAVLLASYPGRAFSREYLLQRLWGYDYDGFDRTVDTHIMRLRKKLGSVGEKIVTVWGVGYRFLP
ncbi:DNA-binding response regulator [Ktedonobacteria bacterium brp13]|nr:DNA-binding response regulator [Ktedonobacteria bacterium brp13]